VARAGKAKLMDSVVKSIEAAGWSVDLISAKGVHPMRLAMERAGVREVLRVYIWNLTHGGGHRSKHEFRIQITGIDGFQLEPGGKTLVLGWSDAFGAFAAFDAGQRTGPLGSSPSIQVLESTLTAAAADGAAMQGKGDGEYAIAVRPDRLVPYVENQAAAHSGDISSVLDDTAQTPERIIIDAAITADVRHQFGSAEELAQRRAILARIDALEAEVARLRPAEDRGHNNPPELLPPEDSAAVTALEDEAASLKGELAKPEPDVRRVGRTARFFSRFVGAWKRAQTEAQKFGGKIADKAREKGAELVIASVAGCAANWGHIVHAAEGLAQAIAKWLGLV
jgi:putative restriction endonuclease